jgi:hypothetical protein
MPAAEYEEPQGLIQEGDTFIGILPNHLKAVATLRAICMREVESIGGYCQMRLMDEFSMVLANGADIKKRMSRSVAELDIVQEELTILNRLLWRGIKEVFPQQCAMASFEKRTLAVKKWWHIVAIEPEITVIDLGAMNLGALAGLDSLFGDMYGPPPSPYPPGFMDARGRLRPEFFGEPRRSDPFEVLFGSGGLFPGPFPEASRWEPQAPTPEPTAQPPTEPVPEQPAPPTSESAEQPPVAEVPTPDGLSPEWQLVAEAPASPEAPAPATKLTARRKKPRPPKKGK